MALFLYYALGELIDWARERKGNASGLTLSVILRSWDGAAEGTSFSWAGSPIF